MSSDSRTLKGAKNASVALMFYVLSLVIQFFSRKVFIEYLGSDILGLNSTAYSLLSFLNMAEMGIGAAVAFTLYKPIAENDSQTIAEIISVQGWFYKRIASIVFVSACVLSIFFPLIFEKTGLPLWYAYSTFGVLLFSTMLSYTTNYKQILLSSHQLEYKITIAYKLPKTIKDIIQIICIWKFPEYGYVCWVIWEGIGAIICTISLNYTIKKEFPVLSRLKYNGKQLRHKYAIILTKVKQLLFHKISSFIVFQTSPLIIYAYTSLTTVAVYGNYMLVVNGLSMLISSLFNGMTAIVGNAIQTYDQKYILSLFKEIYVFRFYITSICCVGFYFCIEPFTKIWIGAEYLLPLSSTLLIIYIMFIQMMRLADIFLQAQGMFQDIWAPIAEAGINIGLSVILGYLFGLNGILFGVAVSLTLIIFIWKPYFLFSKSFMTNFSHYIILNLKLLFIGLINVAIWIVIKHEMTTVYAQSEFKELILSIIYSLGFGITYLLCLLIFGDNMRKIIRRLKTLKNNLSSRPS